jgi:hypothetical protein
VRRSLKSRWALWYAEQGFPVFPCQPNGKEPLTPHGFKDAIIDVKLIREWWNRWPDANIGIPTGTASGLLVIDIDPRNGGEESWTDLRANRAIPITARQRTGGGGQHIFFRCPGHLRGGTLAKGIDLKGDGGYIIAPPSRHPSGGTYRWVKNRRLGFLKLPDAPDWLLSQIRSVHGQPRTNTATDSQMWAEGERNNSLFSLACTMRRRSMSQESIEAALLVENQRRCDPPLDEDEVQRIAASASRYEPSDQACARNSNAQRTGFQWDWPTPLKPDAFHSVAGEIVRLIEPHSEGDPAALLGQFLVMAGNLIGRNVHFVAEADRHHTNLFAVVVGLTAKGRKGTSLGQIQRILAEVDPEWNATRTGSGLSTGEGLISAVQDEGAGVGDKRLLVLEPEFARVLQVSERQSNTLSPVIRQAWDSGSLRIMTKNKPACATDAHISIIAHITKDELRRLLTATAVANGFANRFLWICARRSKILPDGGEIDTVDFEPIIKKLHDAVKFAKKTGEIQRSKQAGELWHEVYPDLSEGKPGVLGSVTSRAEAQVMRLACIYAFLDCSPAIRIAHLRAALEVWRYTEDSARFIFSDAVGDSTADKILRGLRRQAEGLTRDDIRELFNHDKSSEEIERALSLLEEHRLAYMVQERTETRGRPPERWFATSGAREKRGK